MTSKLKDKTEGMAYYPILHKTSYHGKHTENGIRNAVGITLAEVDKDSNTSPGTIVAKLHDAVGYFKSKDHKAGIVDLF